MDLNGKTMLITGASSGIGAATARAAAHAGAQVILVARTRAKLERLAGEIRQDGGRAAVFPVDLTDAQAVAEVATKVTAELGTPDIILNNAGTGRWLFAEETSPQDVVAMMAAPYFAAFFVTRAFLPAMLERNGGCIIAMTSAAAWMTWPGATAYTAGRWAMRGFAEALRADLAGTHIRTMLVTFAKVRSSYFENNPGSEERIPGVQSLLPVLTPEQAAAAIVQGIRCDKREVAAPLMLRVILVMNALFPSVIRQLMTSTGYRRPARSV
jgi:short-subunit dehydrogenase